VAMLIALGVFILVLVGGFLLVKNNPQFLHR